MFAFGLLKERYISELPIFVFRIRSVPRSISLASLVGFSVQDHLARARHWKASAIGEAHIRLIVSKGSPALAIYLFSDFQNLPPKLS